MNKSTTVRAGDIVPEARQWVAGVLHVNLADDDELTLAVHRKADADSEEQRAAARHRLLGVLAKIDEKTCAVPDAEMDHAIAEAMQFVRSSTGE